MASSSPSEVYLAGLGVRAKPLSSLSPMTLRAEVTVRLCVARTAPTSSTWTFVHVLAWNIVANGLSAGIMALGRACPVPDTGVSMT